MRLKNMSFSEGPTIGEGTLDMAIEFVSGAVIVVSARWKAPYVPPYDLDPVGRRRTMLSGDMFDGENDLQISVTHVEAHSGEPTWETSAVLQVIHHEAQQKLWHWLSATREKSGGRCMDCGQAAQERTCSECGFSKWVIECDDYDPPPIAGFSESGLCDDCLDGMDCEDGPA